MAYRWNWRILGFAFFILALAKTEPACAEDASVTVVEVQPTAKVLDTAQLRGALEAELHTTIIGPADDRAGVAQGKLTIQLDRATGEVVVTYLASAKPIARRIALPADRAVAVRSVVLLAGNLARNEGAELAAALRKHPAPSEAEPADKSAAAESEPRRAQRDAALLQATLDHFAENDRAGRHVSAGIAIAGGAVIGGASLYCGLRYPGDKIPAVVGGMEAALFLGGGILALGQPSELERLAAYGRRVGPQSAASTEQAWRSAAQREHRRRRILGIVGLVATGVVAGSAGYFLVDSDSREKSPDPQHSLGIVLLTLSALDAVLIGQGLATEGPVESAFHAYQRSSGRIGTSGAAVPRLQVSATPQGLFGALSATF
jgi:hypothetical protein